MCINPSCDEGNCENCRRRDRYLIPDSELLCGPPHKGMPVWIKEIIISAAQEDKIIQVRKVEKGRNFYKEK